MSDIAIDLGTATTQIHVRGVGVVINEPSVLTQSPTRHFEVAVGREAVETAAVEPSVTLAHPIVDGVVSDSRLASQFVSRLLRVLDLGRLSKAKVIVTVPFASSPIERRVVRDSVRAAGVHSVRLLEQTVAGALGADLAVYEASGTCVVDVGAGVTEAGVFSLGSVISRSSARVGSGEIDSHIVSLMRRDYGLEVLPAVAESIKLTASSSRNGGQLLEAQGLSLVDGRTSTAILELDDLNAQLDRYHDRVIDCVKECLIGLSPELAHDVMDSGIKLVGGAALSKSMGQAIEASFGIEVEVVSDPDLVGVRGAAKCLESPESLEELFLPERG